MQSYQVPTNLVKAAADLVKDKLELAAQAMRGRLAVDDLRAQLEMGNMQLWLVSDGKEIVAIAITEVLKFPQVKICRVVALVGTGRKRWLPLQADIENWARGVGCTEMEAQVRPGLARDLAEWKKTGVVLVKEL